MKMYIYEDIEADSTTGFKVPLLIATVELSPSTVETNKLYDMDSPEADNFLNAVCNSYKINKNDSIFWWEIE